MSKTTEEWQNILDETPSHATKESMAGSIGCLAQKLIRERKEALEEVVCLRRELEELRGTLSKAKIDIARGDYEYGQHTGFLMASSWITRILEGHNDE